MDGTAGNRVTLAKRSAREQALAARRALPVGALEVAGAAITARILALPQVRAARVVAAYVSVGVEIPTQPLIEALLARGTTVLLPVLQPDNSLLWRALTDRSDLVPGRYGLLEPAASALARSLADAQVVVLPGLRYDHSGNRLGRGGGSYDRALKDLPGTIETIGIALDADLVDVVPVQEHDESVRFIVTPTRVITIEDGGR